MKKFYSTSKQELAGKGEFGQALAATLGWGISHVGYEVLDQLEVGETTIDDDGDTWERVE